MLFHGSQHGNEIMAAAAMAFLANDLLDRYGTDAYITSLIDEVDWYICPIMNPDGYTLGMRFNGHLVDLNRNWGGPGSGLALNRGPYPFSEPETAAIRDFLIAHPEIRAYIDFHTYGYYIMWAWSHTPDLCEDQPTLDAVGYEMANQIEAVHGTTYQPGPGYATLYPVSGGSIDYVYGVQHRWAFLIEIGYSHYMPVEAIVPMSEELVPAALSLADWVADCNANGVADAADIETGTSADCNANAVPDECEPQPNFDQDTLFDICDDDMDDDGVLNELDHCDETPPGQFVMADGRPVGDSNGDCYVDRTDYSRFRRCLRVAGRLSPLNPQGACTQYFDFNDDTFVDLLDFARMQNAYDPHGGYGVCGAGNGTCYSPNDGPGCNEAPCCTFICQHVPSCCDAEWTEHCADLARDFCVGQ